MPPRCTLGMGVIDMVSIIVCTYNDSNFLPRALNSCLLQNIEKEIILVDDCSTEPMNPEVHRIIEQNKGSIRFIRLPENGGLSAARNAGIFLARYDYIITLDSDDFFFPRSIRTLIHFANPEYDVYYGMMTSSGKLVTPYSKEITKEVLLNQNPIFCSSIFKKKLWEKVGGYKIRRGAHYEDWNFWCRCFLVGAKFKYIPTLIYEHTERQDSMLRTLEPDKQRYVDIALEELRVS
jgi:glycosyltransferase involved in cell wall biosynthesis